MEILAGVVHSKACRGYTYQKVDPEHISEGPLAYLMSYFEHLASSSVCSVSLVILNLGLLDHQECDDNIGESMCFTVTIPKCQRKLSIYNDKAAQTV